MMEAKEQKAIDNMSSQELWDRARLSLAGGVSHDGRFLPPHPIIVSPSTNAPAFMIGEWWWT